MTPEVFSAKVNEMISIAILCRKLGKDVIIEHLISHMNTLDRELHKMYMNSDYDPALRTYLQRAAIILEQDT